MKIIILLISYLFTTSYTSKVKQTDCTTFIVLNKERIEDGFKYNVRCAKHLDRGVIYSTRDYKGDTIKINK